MRKQCSAALLAALFFCCTGCTAVPQEMSCERTEELLGTFVSVRCDAPSDADAEAAMDAAFLRARELEQIFSPTIADSELNAVNASAFAQDTAVSEDFHFLLEASLDYAARSDGALDCTMGRLIALWGIGTADARIPSDEAILAAHASNGSAAVLLRPDGTVRFTEEEVQLQFGAVAKGYIADEMKEVLLDHGITSGILSLGGNVLTIGEHPVRHDGWSVGITDPFSPDRITATVTVRDASVVTSGNYERYFEENGIRYHHILDPETGCPADAGLVSTTIIAGSSLTCDALSTATYVLGAEAGMALIERTEGAEAVFITENGEFLTSSGISDYEFIQVTE